MTLPTLTFEPNGLAWYADTGRACYSITRGEDGYDVCARFRDERAYETRAITVDGAMLAARQGERDGFDAWSSVDDTPNTSADAGETPRAWTDEEWRGFVAICGCGKARHVDARTCPMCTLADNARNRSCHSCAGPLFRRAGGVAVPDAHRVCDGVVVCGDCYRREHEAEDDARSQRRCHDCHDLLDGPVEHRDCDGQAICGDCNGLNALDTDAHDHREADEVARVAILDEAADDPSVTTLADLFDCNEQFDLEERALLRKLPVGHSWSDGGGGQPWYCIVRLPNMARDAFGAPFDATKE